MYDNFRTALGIDSKTERLESIISANKKREAGLVSGAKSRVAHEDPQVRRVFLHERLDALPVWTACTECVDAVQIDEARAPREIRNDEGVGLFTHGEIQSWL